MESNGSNNVSEYRQNFKCEFVSVDKATEERVLRHFSGPMPGLLRSVGPEKWVLPPSYLQSAEELHNFEARTDDVWVCTFPRSGTTWAQEMMWLLCNDLNYDAAKATDLNDRFPFFELDALMGTTILENLAIISDSSHTPALQILRKMTSTRLIKTHLPIKLMPHESLSKGCKIVYVARNPKDVIVSNFHFARNPASCYTGNFEEYLDLFMDDLVVWGPYFEHLKDGWNRRNDSNVLFLFYEDLIMDLDSSLKKLAKFLNRPLSENDLPQLVEHLNIKNFKENKSVNQKSIENEGTGKWKFIRRGQIGGNPEITPEIADRIDAWTNANLKGTGITFFHP